MTPQSETDVLVVGAGPAGLAVAGRLTARGRRPLVIERSTDVGSAWRTHYERLHLHTIKTRSSLPGMAFPADYPRYVPRGKMVEYLESYAARFEIRPRFGEAVSSIVARAGNWDTRTALGNTFVSRCVVLATGANDVPHVPQIAGRDLFGGRVLHSRDYRAPREFAGERVLVVGMGNTGAEIALDLAEHGVAVDLSVRSPVNVVHRDVLGRPTQLTSIALSRLPTAWGDWLARWLRDLTVGDLTPYGLQLRELGKTPVIDVGTLARIRAGDIVVRPGLERFTERGVRFGDGTQSDYDTVVLATGYRSGVAALLPGTTLPVDAAGLPQELIGAGEREGLYFVGYDVRQPGVLRTIDRQSGPVVESIEGRLAGQTKRTVASG
jgi:hypothetical protein